MKGLIRTEEPQTDAIGTVTQAGLIELTTGRPKAPPYLGGRVGVGAGEPKGNYGPYVETTTPVGLPGS